MLTKSNLLLVSLIFAVFSTLNAVSLAGTLVEDFDDGDAEGWERSPQNQDNDNVFWGIVDGAMMFDPQREVWDLAISQMNFVGTPTISDVGDWTDYEVEVDMKLTDMGNHPGGIRARVDLETGGHYVLWLYPGSGNMTLYKNPGWDINTGIATLGTAPLAAEVDEYHTLKLKCAGDTITVFYDGKEMISAQDKDHPKGTIALCVQNKVVYFDNVKVTGDMIPNVNMSPVEPAGKLTTTWGTIRREH
jgi:hypothetical protein